jgi:hypothetical protein
MSELVVRAWRIKHSGGTMYDEGETTQVSLALFHGQKLVITGGPVWVMPEVEARKVFGKAVDDIPIIPDGPAVDVTMTLAVLPQPEFE